MLPGQIVQKMVKSYNKLVKLYKEEKTDTVLNIIMKINKHTVKALSFTVGIYIAILMIFLAVWFKYNSLQRSETRNT